MSTRNSLSLPLLPLPTGVVFPDMVVTVAVESAEAKSAVAAAQARATEDAPVELVVVPKFDGVFSSVGVVVRMEQQGPLPSGSEGILLRALRRVRVGQGELDHDGTLVVSITELEPASSSPELDALAEQYREVTGKLLRLIGGNRMAGLLDGIDDPGALADSIGWWPELGEARRHELFETTAVDKRIAKALKWAKEALAEAEVTTSITDDVSNPGAVLEVR